MRIPSDISYHRVEDKIFVHSVDTQRNYLLDGDAEEILNYVAANPDCSCSELVEFFATQYDAEEAEEIRSFLNESIRTLLEEKILTETDQYEDSESSSIIEEVEETFLENNRLFSMTLELTYRCVEKCVHCYIDDLKPFCVKAETTTDEWKNILRQARQMGCVKVLLSGGEVLLRPDLCDIAEYAVNLGLIVDVYTTGIGLTDEIFERLCAAKVNSVSFSLYGNDAASHDAITGVRGSFEKTLKAMLMFKSAGVGTFIKSVAIRQNFDALEGLYKLGKRLKIKVSVSTQICSGREWKRAEDYRLGNAKLYEKYFTLDGKYRKLKISKPTDAEREEIRKRYPCSAGLNSMHINPYGEVFPCTHFQNSVGNARKETLENLWSKVNTEARGKLTAIRDLTPACKECAYVEFCHMCLAELEREDKSFRSCGNVLVEAKAAARAYYKQEVD